MLLVDLVWFWAISEIGGWGGAGMLVAGIVVLGGASLRWGYDSRDGRNWTPGGVAAPTPRRPFDKDFVDAEISRLERQWPTE